MTFTRHQRKSLLSVLPWRNAPVPILAVAIMLGGLFSIDVSTSSTSVGTPNENEEMIVHLLNRITYGLRPGDVAQVQAIGVDAYIEQQLHPERINDRVLEAQLSSFETLELDTPTIVRNYHIPAQMARRRQQEAARKTEPETQDNSANTTMNPEELRARRRDIPPEMGQARLVVTELMEQKLIRAVSSDRQLQEVLVDFWFNHFNVSVRKSPLIQPFLTEFERDVIRPNVLGSFRNLLGAVAESPAMLIYLDNWLSSDPDAPNFPTGRLDRSQLQDLDQRRRQGAPRPSQFGFGDPRMGGRMAERSPVQPGPRNGLNENYARELLELHTLGVNGNYSQEDVVEVAKALTGWTIAPLWSGGGFHFEPRLHDDGVKQILGESIDNNGKDAGDAVLDLLASHPSTARFIATKLASRFVADDPPTSLVDRTAQRFLDTDGDLREVTRTILTSPEFLSEKTRRIKVKTPLEFVVSSVRILDGQIINAAQLVRALRDLGMPLYLCQQPTGYSDRADAWVNAGALLSRMNFAVALVSDRMEGIHIDLPDKDIQDGKAVRDVIDKLVTNHSSDTTRSTISGATTPQQVAVFSLGSPEFQRQ